MDTSANITALGDYTATHWLTLIVSFALLVLLYYLARKRVSFGSRVLLALAFGLAVGVWFGQSATDVGVGIFGQIYVNFIKMLVMPLVVATIISSITSVKDPAQLRKIGVKTVGLFLATTAVAALIGLLVALVMDPGAGIAQAAENKPREIPSFSKVLLDLIPANPVAEMAAGKVVPVIIFAGLLAVAITVEGARRPDRVAPVKAFVESFAQIMFRVTKIIIKLTPYGVFGLIASVSARYGLDTLKPLAVFIVAVFVACLLHLVIVFGGLVTFVAKVNPIRFFKKIYPVMAVAFTTRSSYATLPVNLEVLTKRVKVSQRIASFIAPLGATINMNGCGGIYPAIVAVFVARVYGIDLNLFDYGLIVLAATVASVGVAGVPGPASIATTVVLASAGLPLEGMAIVLGVDPIVDMARTAINATGTTVSTLVVAGSEGEFNRKAFNNDKDDELELNAAT